MVVSRHLNRSFMLLAILGLFAGQVSAQDRETLTAQKLLERGDLHEVIERAHEEPGNVEATFFAAEAAHKLNDDARAAAEFSKLRESGDASWEAIGESGTHFAQGNMEEAMQAARRAIEANGDNPFAHYQLGIVANRQGNNERALEAFSRAIALKPDLAYAHYYAGLAAQRLKQIAKMSEHFEIFLKLAPEAPERTAVAALLRTLRPRR